MGLALFTGVVHTALGPDHYVPFIAMAKARRWSVPRALIITALCGVGHVLGSIVLGLVGIAAGLAIGSMEAFESARGDIAAWLLVGFGVAYTAWGVRRAVRNRPHSHWHAHEDGTVHEHPHTHHGEHVHVHDAHAQHAEPAPEHTHRHHHDHARGAAPTDAGKRNVTGWVLFTIFVFGPCEVLIPQLMVPAAQHAWWALAAVTLVFALATIGTMLAVVSLSLLGLSAIRLPWMERYAHATAGVALTACGLAIKFGL